MSSSMRDWIGPAVRKLLDQVLHGTTQDGKISESYSQDGVYITHIKRGEAAQVNEFTTYTPPYQGLLSDSFTQIRAIFTKPSTDQHQKQWGQSFSRGTNGGVLGITDYYLMFNPNSLPSLKIILKIESFVWQGCEGSSNFGRPIHVEMAPAIKALMSKIETKLKNDELDHPGPIDPTSPVQSQVHTSMHDSSFPAESVEPIFSTQAPSKFQNGANLGRHKNLAAPNKALLALLQSAEARLVSNGETYVVLANGDSDLVTPPCKVGQRSAGSSSSDVQSIEPLNGDRKYYDQAPDSVLLSQPTAKKITRASESDESKGSELISDDFLPRNISSNGGTVSSKPIDCERYVSTGRPGITVNAQPRADSINKTTQDISHPWAGLTRIPRKHVQVSKDQQAVLDHDDAWYFNALSDRQPGISLPQNIITSLQAFHDRLIESVGNGQSCSNDDSEESDHDDGWTEDSGSEKFLVLRKNDDIDKAQCTSISGQRLHSSVMVSSDQRHHKSDAIKATPSARGNSPFDDCVLLAKQDSSCQTGARNVEGSYTGVNESFSTGEILLPKQATLSCASSDYGDETSIVEERSWPPSPDMIQTQSANNHPLLEEIQEFANNHQNDVSNAFQSHPPTTNQNLALTSIDAEHSSMEDNDGNSEEESFSVLQSQVEQQPIRAIERNSQAISAMLKNFSGIVSSSPVEMELSVPYALGIPNQPADDTAVKYIFDASLPNPCTSGQRQSVFNPEEVPKVSSSDGLLHKTAPNGKSDTNSAPARRRASASSDPIIPGTFRIDVSEAFTRPVERVASAHQGGPDGSILETCQVISATPDHPNRFHSCVLSPRNEINVSAHKEGHTGAETQVKKIHDAEGSKHASLLMVSTNKLAERKQHRVNSDHIEIFASATSLGASQQALMGSQVSSSEPSPAPSSSPRVDEAVLSTVATPIKRRVSEIQDRVEHSPKRRRTLQPLIFGSVSEKDLAFDPTEMAKANRRKFLQGLAFSSPVPSPYIPHGNPVAHFNIPPDAILEKLVEKDLSKDPASAGSGDVSPLDPPQGQQIGQSVHLETTFPEKVANISLDYSKRKAGDIDTTDSPTRSNEIGNNLAESMDSLTPGSPKKLGCNSVEVFEPSTRRHSYTVTKAQPSSADQTLSEDIFTIFKQTYSSYEQSLRAFIRACVCLDWLHSEKKAPHPSLWDDFIRAFSAEYVDHIEESRLSQRKPLSAPDFYNDHVSEPIFTERVMTQARLREAFLLDLKEAAKGRAKLNRQNAKKQASIPMAQSQETIVDEILTECRNGARSIHGNSSSDQQLPGPAVGTSLKTSDDVWDAVLAQNHVLDAVSATRSRNILRKPFFETPSQLISQTRYSASPRCRSPILGETGDDGFWKDSSECIESLGVKRSQTDMSEHPTRQLSSSMSPSRRFDSGESIGMGDAIIGWPGTRSHIRKSLQQPILSSLRKRKESPILGKVISNSDMTEDNALLPGTTLDLLSNSEFNIDSELKNPFIGTLNPFQQGTISMPELVENGLDSQRTLHSYHERHMPQVAMAQKPFVSKTIATFKDFSRAFIPRKKRRSSAFSVSTPSSDTSTSSIVASKLMGSKPVFEPDTQVWKF